MGLYRSGMRIDIRPEHPALDTELAIRVRDLPPDGRVTVHAESTDAAGRTWTSQATFTADRGGLVDLRRDAPAAGSYQGADGMGLVWSMVPAGVPDSGQARDRLAPVPLRLTAEASDIGNGSAQTWRSMVPDGLVRTDVREHGLVGVLFHPAQATGPWRGVMQLGGAEGGMHEDDAALLAAHGFTVLALAYYGLPGLPPTLTSIPVEYFGRALDYLHARPEVAPGGVSVTGGSKGGEAALLTGATYPDAVRSVVSIVGSAVHTQGISQPVATGSLLENLSTPVASWSYRGRDLPYLPTVVTPRVKAAIAAGDPVHIGWAMPDLNNAAEVEQAMIPVDRITGPVLLLSAGNDQGYGAAYQEIAMPRLTSRARHIVYEHAGHQIVAPPYRPTTRPSDDFQDGGSPAVDAAAKVSVWREIREFLREC
jgi:dienelactone hydrolase